MLTIAATTSPRERDAPRPVLRLCEIPCESFRRALTIWSISVCEG